MGLMTKYIDALSDEARDRIIEAQDWMAHRLVHYESGCLRGHAEGFTKLGMTHREIVDWQDRDVTSLREAIDFEANRLFFSMTKRLSNIGRDASPAAAFNAAVDRFGLERVVRACKLRAAKRNRAELPEMVTA